MHTLAQVPLRVSRCNLKHGRFKPRCAADAPRYPSRASESAGAGQPRTGSSTRGCPSRKQAQALWTRGALDASVRGSGPPLCASSGGASDSESAERSTRAALHLAPRTCASANRPSHRRYQCPGLDPALRIGLRNQHPLESKPAASRCRMPPAAVIPRRPR